MSAASQSAASHPSEPTAAPPTSAGPAAAKPDPAAPAGAETTPGAGTTPAAARGYSATRPQLLARLARVEGQVRGVAKMVEEDRYCIDVLTQINAVRAALDKVALGLLDQHARHCLLGHGGGPSDPDEQAAELMGAVGRMLSR
ncbi:MAG: metal-sensitive transcriptional regulator [Frankia sp.]